MLQPAAQNTAAQGQPHDVRYLDIGYYHVANGRPPLHENHDPAINNYAGAALNVPAQAQAAPPDPVCYQPNLYAYAYLTRPFSGGDSHV